jgi:hypothetical protein
LYVVPSANTIIGPSEIGEVLRRFWETKLELMKEVEAPLSIKKREWQRPTLPRKTRGEEWLPR